MTLATTLREELAVNPHSDDEAFLRCTCDDCVADASEHGGLRVVDAERLRKVFKALDEAAFKLPIPKEWLDHPDVEAFSLAKHHMHVLLHEIASGGATVPTGYVSPTGGENDAAR